MNIRPFVIAIAAGWLSACHLPITFHAEQKGEMTIPGNPFGGVLNIPGVGSFNNIDFNQNQDFVNQGVSKDRVSSVQVDSVKLQITNPNNQGFDFMDTLQIFAKTGDQQVEVAHKTSIRQLGLGPPNPQLTLDVTRAELKPYVTAPSMTLVVNGSGTAPARDTTLSITVGFQVEIRL